MSVYRVAGLPAGISKQTARSIIDQFFVSETQIVIRSLGLHPQTNSIVAISMFYPIPARLLQGSSWKLEQTVSYEGVAKPQLVQLEIDTHFLGFTPLNIVDCDSDDDRIDCILVSGLSSHPFGSWKERGGQFMWLVDDEDANPPHVRVFLYGYDTSLFRSESFQDITDIGERLAVSVRGIRSRPSIVRTPEHRPIVFIAHSLGGLVVKEAICHMAREEPSAVQCICGFIFFGVPHHGLLVEPWLRIIDKQPNKQLVENLRPGSRYLQRLDENFQKSFTLRSLKVVTIYETSVSKTTKEEEAGVITRSGDKEVLVTPTSALGHWPDSVSHTRIAVNRSHENLPKFRGRFDEDYLALKPYLQDVWAPATLNTPKAAYGFGTGERRPDDGGNRRDQPEIAEAAASGTTLTTCTLTSLWPDPETEGVVDIPTTMDVIAIHGLGGNSLNSWREGDKLWLRDFLPWSLPKARVLTFGYDGDLLFTGPSSNIHHFATLLLDNIKQLRQKTGEAVDRKTIFLCHDFGGIIFKQALVMAFENETRYSDIAKSVTGAVFLGTPHRGPDIGFWSELLAKFALLDKSRINLLQYLETRSTELGTICSQFVERGLHLQVFSLYETQVTSGLNARVVDESSAILRLPNETALPLNADHMSMCRYLSSSSQNYVTVSECIAEFFDTMSGKPDQTLLNSSGRDFLSQLRAVDALSTLNRIPNHGNTSSRWLLDHPEFQSWTQLQGRQVVWVHGPPGAGKTALMRSVVAYLAEKSETASTSIISKPVYFFFDDKDSTRKDSMAFVRSILDQIVRDSRTSYLLMYVNERDLKTQPQTEDNLWMCLSTILERSRGIMFQFVVDAMDEVLRSSTYSSITILDRLESLLSIDSSGRIRLLISSRKKPFTEFLEANLAFIDVDNEMTRGNVESFIRTRVQRWLERSYISISVGESIEKKILDVSQGNFLHARLALEQFSEGVHQWSREDVRLGLDRLNRVSHGLASAYCDLLKSIPEQHRGQAKAAFAILRVIQGKLNSRQLSFFSTLSHRKSSNNNNQTTVETLKSQSADFESYLDEACGYMIRRADDGTVDFTHLSAKDLFTECLEGLSPQEQQTIAAYTMSELDANLMMHELCMEIFQLEDRDANVWKKTLSELKRAREDRHHSFQKIVLSEEEIDEIDKFCMTYIRSIGETPCILYAVQNWMHHYAAGRPDSDTDSRLATFLRTVPAYYYHMLWYWIRAERKSYEASYQMTHTRPKASNLSGLFRAVVRGDCPRVVKAIIAKGTTINGVADEEEGITLLSWTIICQRKESFLVLLRSENVQVNYATGGAEKPLHHAAKSEDVFYLEKLLGYANTNVNITSNAGTPLHVAMSTTNLKAAHLLVDHPDIDIGAKHTTQSATETPYSLVFKDGRWESLLEKMITIRSKSLAMKISGTSQFFLAGVHRWERVEEIILRTDPYQVLEIDLDTGMNALESYAFFGRREKLLWILDHLPRREFPMRRTRQKYDLLHLCADQNWPDVVVLLRERYGLTSLPSDHVGRTLLHWALEYNWDMTAVSLEDYSSGNLDTKDRDGLTAVHIAVSNRNMDALMQLVSSGANFLQKDRHGMTPVHLAADQGFRAALEYFIDMPQKEFGTTKTGASLLHLLSLWFDGALVRRFVTSKEVIVNVVDKNRRSPLHYAALVNNASTTALLLEMGCKINTRDRNGMTPLHEAIRGRNTETAMLLLGYGADTRARDAFEQSCLHLSLRYGHDELVTRFLEESTEQDINAVDKFGMTPLHRACGTGRVDDVKALRKLGANWNVRNKYGRYPIDLAVEARNTSVVKLMISWAQSSGHSQRTVDQCLEGALVLACETEASRIKNILMGEGLQIDQSKIKVRRLYMTGPTPESRWPLVSYSDAELRRQREQREKWDEKQMQREELWPRHARS